LGRSKGSTRRHEKLATSRWRKLAFTVVAVALFFALVELLLALFGVRPATFEKDPYVGFSGYAPLFEEREAVDGTVYMVRAPSKQTLFNPQRFPREKGSGTYRVFCVGGSTTYGRPYGDVTSFCGWLREFLAEGWPERTFEVVNAGGISYASYRVAVLMEELIRYEPDLFIVYSGHNEFLERRSYPQIIATPEVVRGIGSVASRTRTWAALELALDRLRDDRDTQTAAKGVLGAEVATLLDDAVGPSAYTRDDELREKVLQHYRYNLDRMIRIARSVGAGVVMVAPASNLRDAAPFKSEPGPGVADPARERWNAAATEGLVALRGGDPAAAASLLTEAARIDPRHADTQFALGRALDAVGQRPEARAAFERARDEDVCPLRALGPMPGIVREVAAAHGVPVVDFERLADAWAADGIPGADLFLDHVHPVIDANRRLSVVILEELVDSNLIEHGSGWDEAAILRVTDRVEGGLDANAHATALTNLSKVIGWAGKLEEAYGLSRQAVELDPNDVQVQYQAGLTADLLGRHEEAVAHYLRAIEIQPDAHLPHGNLAVNLERQGRLDEAVEHYRIAFRNSSPEDLDHHRRNLADALVKLGFVVYRQGDVARSLSLLSEADQVLPGNPEILSRLGTALMANGRTGEAADRLTAAARMKPGDAGAHNRLALALALDSRLDEAAAAYRQALALDPSIVSAPDNVFVVLQRMGRAGLATELRARLSGEE
jgi:tetratricopeptide (TPR) repeat protein